MMKQKSWNLNFSTKRIEIWISSTTVFMIYSDHPPKVTLLGAEVQAPSGKPMKNPKPLRGRSIGL